MRKRNISATFIEGLEKNGESILVRMEDAIKAMKKHTPAITEIGSDNIISALVVKHLWSQRLIIAPMLNNSFEPNLFWKIKRGDTVVAPIARLSPRIMTDDFNLPEVTDEIELDIGFTRNRQTDETSSV
jgi:hypothetical protein